MANKENLKPFRRIDKSSGEPLADDPIHVRLHQSVRDCLMEQFTEPVERAAWLRRVIRTAALQDFPEYFSNDSPKAVILQAIGAYESGLLDLTEVLLETLLKSPTAASAEAYLRNDAIAPFPVAAYQWIQCALDRVRKEQGEDRIAPTPVITCLSTALNLVNET